MLMLHRQSRKKRNNGDFLAKRGSTKHLKRIATPTAVPISDKKSKEWIIRLRAGPHPADFSIPLGVILREILGVAKTLREVRHILSARLVQVDGKVRTDEKFPVGLMDVVSFPKSGKNYRITVDWKGRLVVVEVDKKDATSKTLRITGKHTVKGLEKGKLNYSFHDGKNLITDNHLRVGDSIIVSIPDGKLKSHLKLETGAHCLVMEGKHAGNYVKLKEIIQRKAGKPNEAKVEGKNGEFITVAKYLFVVKDEITSEPEVKKDE